MERYAAAYVRVSTEEQTEYSPDAQLRAIERYAQQHSIGLRADCVYTDEGFSGRRAEKRPAFMEMIGRAKSKDCPFEVILVHRFDRFARSREDSVVYKSLLRKECGIRVLSVTEPLEEDKFSVILEAMLEAMAEYYSINLSEEVKKGMTEKALRGQLQCLPAYGYRAEENQLSPIPEEAATVREIFDAAASGKSPYAIAKMLNQKGLRTRKGCPFESRAIAYILHNPVYTGRLRWTPTGATGRNFHNPDSILAASTHPPLVSDEVWRRVQSVWNARAGSSDNIEKFFDAGRDFWLKGLCRCANCGSRLVFAKPHYFRCGGYAKGSCSSSQHVACELLEQAVMQNLQEVCAMSVPVFWEIHDTFGHSIQNVEAIKIQLKRKRDRLLNSYLEGYISETDFQKRQRKMEAEEDRLQLSSQMSPAKLSKKQIQEAIHCLQFKAADASAKRAAFLAVADGCIWDKSSGVLQILYKKTSPNAIRRS